MIRAYKHPNWTGKRHGSTLILVLACCVVATSLVMLSVGVSLRQRRQLRTEHQLEQTRWVLDAAIRKAIAESPKETIEIEIKPKLEKFDKVVLSVSLSEETNRVMIQAKVENLTGTNVTARSASFETIE